MAEQLLTGLALLLVAEGILPFLTPERYREWMRQVLAQSDQALRLIGFGSMVIGVLLLIAVT